MLLELEQLLRASAQELFDAEKLVLPVSIYERTSQY
jgi:hypothetical protein